MDMLHPLTITAKHFKKFYLFTFTLMHSSQVQYKMQKSFYWATKYVYFSGFQISKNTWTKWGKKKGGVR